MIILEAPELGGRMSLQLHHPPEGVHYSSFLMVPEPGEPLGKGANGGLPVDVLQASVCKSFHTGWRAGGGDPG